MTTKRRNKTFVIKHGKPKKKKRRIYDSRNYAWVLIIIMLLFLSALIYKVITIL